MLSSSTRVGLPVRIAAETWPLHASSMKTFVVPMPMLALVSVTWTSVFGLKRPGMNPRSVPLIGAWRVNEPKSSSA